MADLKNPKWMYAKGGMFLIIRLMTFGLLLVPQDTWQRVVLQLLMIWAFARAYYFAFYVIEHYVDGTYKFAGLIGFVTYLWSKRRTARDLSGNE